MLLNLKQDKIYFRPSQTYTEQNIRAYRYWAGRWMSSKKCHCLWNINKKKFCCLNTRCWLQVTLKHSSCLLCCTNQRMLTAKSLLCLFTLVCLTSQVSPTSQKCAPLAPEQSKTLPMSLVCSCWPVSLHWFDQPHHCACWAWLDSKTCYCLFLCFCANQKSLIFYHCCCHQCSLPVLKV